MPQHIAPKPGPWDGEPRPLFLAPMAGVSDLPFRLLAKACGADVTITEFTNSTALSREAAVSWRKMESHETEVPFIPQIFGGDPGDMATAAEMLAPTADIIDLNFGCPAPKVTKICAGAALMGEPDNLVSMVDGIIQRVDVPVTAKMRLGTGQGANNALDICKVVGRHWDCPPLCSRSHTCGNGILAKQIGIQSSPSSTLSKPLWSPTVTWWMLQVPEIAWK